MSGLHAAADCSNTQLSQLQHSRHQNNTDNHHFIVYRKVCLSFRTSDCTAVPVNIKFEMSLQGARVCSCVLYDQCLRLYDSWARLGGSGTASALQCSRVQRAAVTRPSCSTQHHNTGHHSAALCSTHCSTQVSEG